MKGHIRKRGERSWAVVLDIGRDPVTGKRQQKWHTVHGTKKDAERVLANLLADLNRGTYVEPTKISLSEYLEYWLDTVRAKLSPKTQEGYSTNIKRHICPSLGRIPVGNLKPMHIQSLYTSLLELGLAPRTVLYVHRTLHAALGQAVKWQVLSVNPADAVQAPRVERNETPVLSADESATLIRALQGDLRLGAPAALALTTGMRRGEVLGLAWEHVSLEQGWLEVKRILQRLPRQGLVTRPPKTEQSRRTVSLPALAVDFLRRWKKQQAEERLLMGSLFEDRGFVFTWPDGRPLDPYWVSHSFARLVCRLGLPKVRFHDLRHTHATLLLQEGIHPKLVSERLGHSQISITLDTYSHVTRGMQREVAATVDKIFGGSNK